MSDNTKVLFKRAIVAIAILWIVVMFFCAYISTPLSAKATDSMYYLYKPAIIFWSKWLIFITPSIFTFLILWTNNKNICYKKDFLNKKTIRFSISWIIISCILLTGYSINRYGTSLCNWGDPSSCSNLYDGFIDLMLMFIFLQIPILLSWLIAWVIKGKSVFANPSFPKRQH